MIHQAPSSVLHEDCSRWIGLKAVSAGQVGGGNSAHPVVHSERAASPAERSALRLAQQLCIAG
eukprot:4190621-Pleurochrysis_carterae.AAC.2